MELKEKEERLKKAHDSFHQQIADIQTQLKSKDDENQQLKQLVASNREKKEDNETQFEDEVTCVVCLDLFIEPYTLSCSHTVCGDCLDKWMAVQKVRRQ